MSSDIIGMNLQFLDRQDSTKQKHAVIQREHGGSEESPGLPSSPKAVDIELEPVVVAESFDKLMEHKSIKKQRDKLNKKLDDLQKDFDKEKYKIEEELGIVTKTRVHKTSSRLIKRISSKNLWVLSVILFHYLFSYFFFFESISVCRCHFNMEFYWICYVYGLFFSVIYFQDAISLLKYLYVILFWNVTTPTKQLQVFSFVWLVLFSCQWIYMITLLLFPCIGICFLRSLRM